MENNSEREQLIDEIARHYKKILELIGEDVNREGLVKTPRRAAKALVDITRGYKQRPDEIVKSALFEYADGTMVGLSKLARVVDAFAHRLQVQERFTAEICDSLYENLSSKGVIVAVSAGHLCMKMRGVEKQGANTFTLEYRGDFENPQLRDEFFRMIKE